jgi:hypothetical protein
MTSGDSVSVARCGYCGREFDVRRFQVRVVGRPTVYDSAECARLDDVGDRARARRSRGVGRRAPLR